VKKHDVMEHAKLKKFLKHIPADTFLFRQGELGNTMFIILDGTVELIAERNEATHVTGILEAGEFLGERAITMKEAYRRYYSAKAIQHTNALEIGSQDLEFLRITAPDIMTDIMVRAFNVAARRLSRMNILVHSLRSSDNDERFIRCILYFCRTAGREMPGGTEVALSAQGIHYYIDMPLAEVEARLNDLQARQLIERVNHEFFFIRDVGAIAAELPENTSTDLYL
jgi:CRP-like cAMP-binding protein